MEDNILYSSYVVDLDPIFLVEIDDKYDVHICISHEPNHPFHLIDNNIDPLASTITFKACNQLVKSCFQFTEFQSIVRQKMFKPISMPYHLHPYPPNFVEYLPHFTGEDHITSENHLGSFHNFIDNY